MDKAKDEAASSRVEQVVAATTADDPTAVYENKRKHVRQFTVDLSAGQSRVADGKASGKVKHGFLTEDHSDSEFSGIILPFTPWKLYWDMTILILMLFYAVTVPALVAFDPPLGDGWTFFDWGADFLFFMDC